MNKFLEIKVTDGLGNQLFQYATGRSFCIKNKITHLVLNAEKYDNKAYGRKFRLKKFNTSGKVINNRFIKKLLKNNERYSKLVRRLPFYKVISDTDLKLQPLKRKPAIITSLQGYWQSEFYFKEIRPILIKELVPIQMPPFPVWITQDNTVAVHIRRTDYLSENLYGVLSKEYYNNAMHFIKNKITEPVFIFFSDDIAWCKKEFNNDRNVFCDEKEWGKDYLQLFLMSRCKHQIIANSSFSWWGAWLNDYPKKIVMRPARPFLDESLVYESYYPAEWISIAN